MHSNVFRIMQYLKKAKHDLLELNGKVAATKEQQDDDNDDDKKGYDEGIE